MPRYHAGDHVIYMKSKVSQRPTPAAARVHPAAHGDDYAYVVDKYWTVQAVLDDGSLEVSTRTGKTHRLAPDDPRLRKAGFLDEIRHRGKFPARGPGKAPPTL